MSYLGNEDTLVEKPAINYLVDRLGYTFLDGRKLTKELGERESDRDVILKKHLVNSLRRINPWINETNLHKAVLTLSNGLQHGTSLDEINEKIYDIIVKYDMTVEQTVDYSGKKKFQTVKYIDFENIENNTFHVVSQLKIKGVNESCIPDLIIYINGIPIVVIECKSPFKEIESNVRVGKKDGYEQLRRYMKLRGSADDEGIDRKEKTS